MPKPSAKSLMSFRLLHSVKKDLHRLAKQEQRTIEVIVTRAIVAEIAKAKIEDEMTREVA